jgi:pimeloyl-ACP methyl ester carboxylesterase
MTTITTHINLRRAAWRLGLAALVLLLAASVTAVRSSSVTAATTPAASQSTLKIKIWKIRYISSTGVARPAFVILPASYGPGHDNPALPLVISPHGRGGNGLVNAGYWGNLPAVGGFAVVNPDGMGLHTARYSFAYRGQIDDLAKMPEFVTRALPWLRIDRKRIYVLGSSMGGLETLMLVARHPHLLAGAAAMDSVANLTLRYRQMPDMPCNKRCVDKLGKKAGILLQAMLVREVGSKPAKNPRAWAARSPIANAKAIAFSGVPLQIWWSRKDRIVTNQASQSGALFEALRRINPHAPISEYVGSWAHSTEMRYTALLPVALAGFGLMPAQPGALPTTGAYMPAESA